MKRMKRIAAGIASLAMVASMAVAMPLGASAATSYTGLIGTTAPTGGVAAAANNDNVNRLTIANSAIEGSNDIVSYNATEFKKILEIEDTANIPNVTFNYAVTVPNAELSATYNADNSVKTLAVFKGINPANITYKSETVASNAFVTTDTNTTYLAAGATNSNLTSSTGTAFTLTYNAQTVALPNDAAAAGENSLKSVGDNVLINNINSADGKPNVDTYYAIKTVQMDFSNCGFTEPGIYRYYVQESGYNQGVTNDYNVTGNDNCWRTIDVYVEDATYTPAGATTAVNALRIAGYVMYVGKQTAGPAAGTGTATAANSMEDGLTHTNPSGNGGTNGVEVASATKSEGIRNIYETSDIKFSKTVAGNQASKDKYFKFHIALTPDTRNDAGSGATLTVNDTDKFVIKNTGASDTSTYDIISSWNSDDTKPNSATTYTKGTIYNANAANAYEETAGTVSYRYVTGAQLKAGYDFYLQDGQEITIQGLPNGIGYTLAEYQDDYTPTVAMTSSTGFDNKNGDTTGSEITAPVIANVSNVNDGWTDPANTATITDTKILGDVKAAFTNTREGTIPTGILLSVAAPAGVGAVVIGGIAYLLVKNKRRRAEEE